MGNPEPVVVIVVLGVALLVSCGIADAASGGRRGFAWGLLGPIGWLIAAARGIQERLDGPGRQPRKPT